MRVLADTSPRLHGPEGKTFIELEAIYDDPTIELRIDVIIRTMWEDKKLRSHWQSVEQALRFGRCALRRATGEAIAAKEQLETNRHFDDWHSAEEDVETARRHLRQFIARSVGGNENLKKGNIINLVSLLSSEEYWSTHQAEAAREAGTTADDPIDRHNRAQTRAQQLLDTLETLDRFAGFAVHMVDHIRPMNRQNKGNPDQRAFVFTMAEGWLALTGKAPRKGSRLNKNPFMRFAASAWKDAGGNLPDTADSFGQDHLKAVVPIMERRLAEGKFRPFWG